MFIIFFYFYFYCKDALTTMFDWRPGYSMYLMNLYAAMFGHHNVNIPLSRINESNFEF